MVTSADRGSPLFAAIGRFAVGHRWAIVAGSLVATVAAVALLPSLGSVIKNDNTAFLPPDAPSLVAAKLAAPFIVADPRVATIVAVRSDGPLTAADQVAVDRIERAVRKVPSVEVVRDAALSIDRQARTALVDFSTATDGGGPAAAAAVRAVRAVARADAPPGLEVYVTGPLPELVDQQAAAGRTAGHVQLITGVFILLLLLLVFRSTLAPLVTLAPAVLALALAGPLIATASKAGIEISSLMQLLLTALVLGAGTDYGLFVVFRYRENLTRGLEPTSALVAAVERVGSSIAYSAFTVIGALLSLLLASFGLYRGVGPGLAIGILVVLLVELFVFPALLSILGRAVFWPTQPKVAPPQAGQWGAIAARVSRSPVRALVIGTTALALLALSLLAYAPSGFNPGGFIAGSDSGIGQAVLAAHFGEAALGTTDIVIRLPQPVWQGSRTDLIAVADQRLEESGRFSSVTGALNVPGGFEVPPEELAEAYRLLGPPADLAPVAAPGSFGARDPQFYDFYRSSTQYISPDGRTLLYRVTLRAGGPGSTAALQAMGGIRQAAAEAAHDVGASASGVAGQAAGAADVSSISGSDILRIAPVVLVVLALLLALGLRSLIAPLYLVASVALSYLASLGLAVLIFVVIGGQLGINFTLPFFMFVFIMALGEDYNILVMTRIREEAAVLPLRRAVAVALGTTGTTVTSAGLVLAGTFGVLAVATSGQVRQIGVGLSLGILLDTFVVRTLLVPSAAVLVGRWNWWPSRLFSEAPATEPAPGPDAAPRSSLVGERVPPVP